MLSSFNNPWFTAVTDPLWAVRTASETAARCIDAELLADPQSLTDYCIEPMEQRLNPFDFHGRRRPVPPVRAGDGYVAMSR